MGARQEQEEIMPKPYISLSLSLSLSHDPFCVVFGSSAPYSVPFRPDPLTVQPKNHQRRPPSAFLFQKKKENQTKQPTEEKFGVHLSIAVFCFFVWTDSR